MTDTFEHAQIPASEAMVVEDPVTAHGKSHEVAKVLGRYYTPKHVREHQRQSLRKPPSSRVAARSRARRSRPSRAAASNAKPSQHRSENSQASSASGDDPPSGDGDGDPPHHERVADEAGPRRGPASKRVSTKRARAEALRAGTTSPDEAKATRAARGSTDVGGEGEPPGKPLRASGNGDPQFPTAEVLAFADDLAELLARLYLREEEESR